MRLQAMGFLLAAAMSAGCGWAQDVEVIRGQVNFVGAVPEPDVMKIAGDSYCEDIHSESPITRDDVIVNPDKTLKNVVVWIVEGWPEGKKPVSSQAGSTTTLRMQKCEFYPHVLAVQAGQQITLKNVDDTVHNLNSLPKINERQNFTLLPEADPVSLSFSEPEVAVRLRSDIHPWMIAWVAVFDHSAFAVTGDDGRFEFPNLPAGEYKLAAWHEKFGAIETEVLLQKAIPATVDFTFTATGAKSGME